MSRRAPAPRRFPTVTHFDLTDVAAHASGSSSLTGIQRVQLECLRTLVANDRRCGDVFANLHGFDVDLRPLFAGPAPASAEALFLQMRRLFAEDAGAARTSAKLARSVAKHATRFRGAAARLRREVVGPRFGPGDRLFVGGAFWAHPRCVSAYESAARAGCEVVVLFHDVFPLTVPDLADENCRPLYERMLRLRSRALTVSQHSRDQIERVRREIGAEMDLPPAMVTPLAHEFSQTPRNFVGGESPTARLAALEPTGPFVLCVGTVEPRKNQLALIGLWERLSSTMGSDWPRLVVAGKVGWRADEVVQALRRHDPAGPCVWIETPTDEELAWLYARARFTVFPSLAEGWGLPIGESLWFGKPCVASNVDSMPEVGGDLCLYADPRDIDSFAGPIVRLVRDEDFYRGAVASIRAAPLRTWKEAAEGLIRAASLPSGERGASLLPAAGSAIGRRRRGRAVDR